MLCQVHYLQEMKSTLRNYSESFAQTIVRDPEDRIQNFHLHQSLSINSIQTDAQKTAPLLLLLEPSSHDDDDEGDENLAYQLQKRLNPTTQEDFAVLQSELLQWRRREERKILITCGNTDRKRELNKALLTKETCLLRKIEALKNVAQSKVKANKVEQSISKMAQPKTWETCHGEFTVEVETPKTSLAREMMGMHDAVRTKVDKIPARIDLLQRIKIFLHRMHFSTTIVKDILVLVNRELEIIQRDTELGDDMLEGLRTRLTNLFANLVLKTNTQVEKAKPKLLIKSRPNI